MDRTGSRERQSRKSGRFKPVVDESATLFDGTLMDVFETEDDKRMYRLMDSTGMSSYEARLRLGIPDPTDDSPVTDTPQAEVTPISSTEVIDQADQDIAPGVSLDLGIRATAFAGIMDSYNGMNRTLGARQKLGEGTLKLRSRFYPNQSEVVQAMGTKNSSKIGNAQDDIDILSGHDELIKAGFEPKEVLKIARNLRKELVEEYGPGRAFYDKRLKAVKAVQPPGQKWVVRRRRKTT